MAVLLRYAGGQYNSDDEIGKCHDFFLALFCNMMHKRDDQISSIAPLLMSDHLRSVLFNLFCLLIIARRGHHA